MQNNKNKLANNTLSQRQRLLRWLQQLSITTIEARHELDILGEDVTVWPNIHYFLANIIKKGG